MSVRKLDIIAWIITLIVWLLVGAMRQYKIPVDADTSFLAGFNALCNTGVTLALLSAFFFIRRKNIPMHRRSVYVAMTLSAFFLLSYVGYHFTNEEIPYCGTGVARSIYYFILFSHIILAGLSLPFILMAFIRGYKGLVPQHRRLVRWVYPVWLYVAATGPVVYLFLLPCR
jgi:putative membrane protein